MLDKEDFDSFQSELLLQTAQNQQNLAQPSAQRTSNGLCV